MRCKSFHLNLLITIRTWISKFWLWLLLQQQVHNRAGELHCNKCEFKCGEEKQLNEHEKTAHRTCPECGKVFIFLEKHINFCLKKRKTGWMPRNQVSQVCSSFGNNSGNQPSRRKGCQPQISIQHYRNSSNCLFFLKTATTRKDFEINDFYEILP